VVESLVVLQLGEEVRPLRELALLLKENKDQRDLSKKKTKMMMTKTSLVMSLKMNSMMNWMLTHPHPAKTREAQLAVERKKMIKIRRRRSEGSRYIFLSLTIIYLKNI
jgi:hypothetical protein